MIIPFYVAFSQDEYEQAQASGADSRRDTIMEALETSNRPVADIDQFFGGVVEELKASLDEETANSIVFGATDWDGENLTDGMRINPPDQVGSFAEALEDIEPEDFDSPDAVETLIEFYTAAAQRGDAVAVYFS